MTLPQIFATVPTNTKVAGAQLDLDLNQIGTMGVFPCTAVGDTTIALVPFPNLPALSAYDDYQRFAFVAAGTSTGLVTVNFAGLGALPWYAADGVTQLDAGQVALGEYYDLAFIQALNSGGGGFISAAASSAPSGPVGPHSIFLSNLVQAPAQVFLGNPNSITADVEFMDVPTSRLLMLGDANPSLIAGPGIAIAGTWPDQTVSFTATPSPLANGALNVEGLIRSDGTILQGLNIASVTVMGAGHYLVTFTTPFTGASYAAIADIDNSKNQPGGASVFNRQAGSIEVFTWGGVTPSVSAFDFSIMCSGVSSAPAYHADAVHFDGSTYLYRNTFLSGVADSPTGTFSVWFRDLGSTSAVFGTQQSLGSPAWLEPADLNHSSFPPFIGSIWSDGGGSNLLDVQTPALSLTGLWRNIIVSWNTNFAAGTRLFQVAVDGVLQSETINTDSGVAFDTPYTSLLSWAVGASGNSTDATESVTLIYFGDMANLLFWAGLYTDLTSPASIPLFINGLGKPVDPATAIGSLGTPTCAFIGDAAAFVTNQGSGGTFTVTGTITDAGTSPSD